jgi:Fe-S-cluster containining protein
MKPKPRNTSHTSRTPRPAGKPAIASKSGAGSKAGAGGKPATGGRPGPSRRPDPEGKADHAGKPGSAAKLRLSGKPAPAGKAAPTGKPSPTGKAAPAPKTAWSKSAAKARNPEIEDFSITSCECDHCRAACLNAPGWFMPDQIPKLARHLKLTVEETFRKYLAIGVTQLADGTQKSGVMPHKLRDGKKPGARWSLGEIAEPGRCVFYDRGRCSIYAVRPYECARMMHDRGDGAVRLRRQIVPRWTDAALAPFLALTRAVASGRSGRR